MKKILHTLHPRNHPPYLIRILAGCGILITIYLIYRHYASSSEAFCNINEYINCDIVNKSIYAEIAGIPVSVLGFGAYIVFFLGTFIRFQKNLPVLTMLAGIGLIFSLYLTYIEFFVLQAICIFCIAQQIIIIFLFLILLHLWRKRPLLQDL